MQFQDNKPASQPDPVMNFIRQAVLEKYGKESDQDFIKSETQKIYKEFGDNLFDYFKPMISKERRLELDELINNSSGQEKILGFLMDSIDNFEQKIIQYLTEFKKNYILGK